MTVSADNPKKSRAFTSSPGRRGRRPAEQTGAAVALRGVHRERAVAERECSPSVLDGGTADTRVVGERAVGDHEIGQCAAGVLDEDVVNVGVADGEVVEGNAFCAMAIVAPGVGIDANRREISGDQRHVGLSGRDRPIGIVQDLNGDFVRAES